MNQPSPDHADAIQTMLPQLLLAIVKNNGGEMAIPVADVDDTANENLAFCAAKIDGVDHFKFTIVSKAGQG